MLFRSWMFGKNVGNSQDFCLVYNPETFHYQCKYSLISNEEFKGKWHDIIVHAIWSVDANKGVTEVWVDGGKAVDFRGATRTVENSTVYFKYGIYRPSNNMITTVYYDEIRKGKTRDDVDVRILTQK